MAVKLIETVLQDYLVEALQVPVLMAYPPHHTKRFVLLEKTGGGFENRIAYATFALQAYGDPDISSDTPQLCAEGVLAMLDAISLDEISAVSLNSGGYDFPDLTHKRPRYQAVFDITHYLTP